MKGNLLSQNEYWYKNDYSNAPEGLCDQPATELKLSYKRLSDGHLQVTVRNTGKTAAILVEVHVADAATGDSVLPAYTSDNYFNLLPGHSQIITIDHAASPGKMELVAEGVNCNSKINI